MKYMSNWLLFTIILVKRPKPSTPQVAPLYKNPYRYGLRDQYICHCAYKQSCNTTSGECPDDLCDLHWFGPSCQFRSLKFENAAPRDRQGETGPRYGVLMTLNLIEHAIVSWIRLVSQNKIPANSINISYRLTNTDELFCKQNNMYSANREGGVLDIYCPSESLVESVTLSSENSLGDVYISGGQNIALGVPTVEQSSLNNTAYFAVDGVINMGFQDMRCSGPPSIDGLEEAWWAISFSNPQDISSVEIAGEMDYPTLIAYDSEGLVLYQKNTTEDDRYYVHFIHGVRWTPSTEIKNVKRMTVSDPGTICEIFIFGGPCPTSYYGSDCSQKCGACADYLCNPFSGVCFSVCTAGYTNSKCDDRCPNGTYGLNCMSTCGPDCLCGCDHIDGSCLSDCRPGTSGTSSESETNGKDGTDDTSTCKECRWGCNHVDGTCFCQQGYTGKLCDKACPNGTYGLHCNSTCSQSCLGGCDHINGSCLSGCQPGSSGTFCESACPNGTYGLHCNSTCSQSCLGGCDHINGSCLSGCQPGSSGTFCKSGSAVKSSSPVKSGSFASTSMVIELFFLIAPFFAALAACLYILTSKRKEFERREKSPPRAGDVQMYGESIQHGAEFDEPWSYMEPNVESYQSELGSQVDSTYYQSNDQ